ncbi:zinc finger protein 862-like [Haliotis asinina]|uniref:zinc finger protein 862-like n=1 Tax=Haliotis asinina TaxID=109174 RepID=UPI003531E7A0
MEGEPFSKFASFCQLQSKNGLSLGTNYLNRNACATFVQSIANVVKENTASELEKCRFVSVLSDGSTDSAITEQEIVYVRYVTDDGVLKTRLADIVDLEHGHAKGVKDGIFQGLSSVGLSKEDLSRKLVGINTDGASVNLGKKGGAVKLIIDELKEEYNAVGCEQYITVVHCIAHNLELAVCDTKKECNYLKNFEDVLKGIFKLFYYSPKRRRELYVIAENLDKELKHYGGIKEVRWVASQHRALKSLLDNFEVTVVHLGEIASGKDESSAKARNNLAELKSRRFLKMLHFMIDFTDLVSEVSKAFQMKKSLISELKRRIETLREKFLKMKSKKGPMFEKILEESKEGKFRGEEMRTEKRGRPKQTQHGDDDDNVNKDIDCVLDSIYIDLQERFIKHLGGEPHSLFTVFDFRKWPNYETQPDEFREYGDAEIQKLVKVYSPLLTDEEKTKAVDEWLDLKMYMKDLVNQSLIDAYEFLVCSGPDRESNLTNIFPLVNIMLTVSPSTADCESSFSRMNRLKTNLKTSMNQDTLSNLLQINIDGPSFEEFEPQKSIINWLHCGKGIRHVHGHKCPELKPEKVTVSEETVTPVDEIHD